MNFEDFREYCLGKPFVSEGFPFDHKTLVMKVAGKLFALADIEDFNSINLKCDPEKAIELRERFAGVHPGYHMSKKHWNTVDVKGSVSDKLILELIDHSYELVFQSLPKKVREAILS